MKIHQEWPTKIPTQPLHINLAFWKILKNMKVKGQRVLEAREKSQNERIETNVRRNIKN